MGAARDSYEVALRYAVGRRQFEQPVASFQLTQRKLVDMVLEIQKGLLVALQTGRQKDAGTLSPEQISFGKLNNVREAIEICREARTVLGGNGIIVALSSVAGERPRRSNFVYGSAKAGFDAFYVGLSEALRPLGGRVLVVRPGFVSSKMTTGLDPAPLAVSPAQVAAAVVAGVDSGAEQVWVPRAIRPVMSALCHLPRPVFRRLPL